MKFHYSLSEKDLVDYFIYKVDSDVKRKQRTNLIILVISLFYFFLGLSNLFREKFINATLFIALGILFYFTITPLNRWYTHFFFTKKVRKDLQAHIGKHTHISLEDKKIIITDELQAGAQNYSALDILSITQLQHVTLMLLKNNECIIVSNETISQPIEFAQEVQNFAHRNNIEIHEQRP